MTTILPPLRLALAAAPTLLADTLRMLLEDDRTEVSLVLSDVTDPYDVAVVTEECDVAVNAPVRIVLDDGPGATGGGTVTCPTGIIPLPDLAALLRYVRELATLAPRAPAYPEG